MEIHTKKGAEELILDEVISLQIERTKYFPQRGRFLFYYIYLQINQQIPL